MAYNKAKAEKTWLENKSKEEVELRKLNFSEEKIAELRCDDWEWFKSERRFYEQSAGMESCDLLTSEEQNIEIHTIQQLLDNIESPELYKLLLSVDQMTLQIILYKMNGYSPNEISKLLSITNKAIYCRLDRLKEKIKKVL